MPRGGSTPTIQSSASGSRSRTIVQASSKVGTPFSSYLLPTKSAIRRAYDFPSPGEASEFAPAPTGITIEGSQP